MSDKEEFTLKNVAAALALVGRVTEDPLAKIVMEGASDSLISFAEQHPRAASLKFTHVKS